MVTLKSPAEIEIMAEGGRRLGLILKALRKETKAGITTDFLDQLSFKLIKESDSKPAFLGYSQGGQKTFPKTLCASVNDVVVHGLPSGYVLKKGDLVKLDLGLIYSGFYLDSAITVGIEPISPSARKLIHATEEALALGIKAARTGQTLGDIGYAIFSRINQDNFSIVEKLTGHGIGLELHEDPTVLNFGHSKSGMELVAGMVIAIEPMVSLAPPPQGGRVKEMADGSFVVKSGALSAHFEHTIAITPNGPRVLTRV